MQVSGMIIERNALSFLLHSLDSLYRRYEGRGLKQREGLLGGILGGAQRGGSGGDQLRRLYWEN